MGFALKIAQLHIPILGHASTEDQGEGIKNELYEQLYQTIEWVPKEDILILLGDFNARITAYTNNQATMADV